MASDDINATGLLLRAVAYVAATFSTLWHHATKDGTLAAFGRQGIDELGEALKAFPEAIQTQESGSIWNPTQGEIAASRSEKAYGHGLRSPSEIAGDRGSVFGNERGAEPLRSPSEIAADRTNREPERDAGREHANDNERGLEHER